MLDQGVRNLAAEREALTPVLLWTCERKEFSDQLARARRMCRVWREFLGGRGIRLEKPGHKFPQTC